VGLLSYKMAFLVFPICYSLSSYKCTAIEIVLKWSWGYLMAVTPVKCYTLVFNQFGLGKERLFLRMFYAIMGEF